MRDTPYHATGFFAGASDALKALMDTLGREVSLNAAEVLMEQGENGDALYVVLSGELEVSVLASDGRRLALNALHVGDVVGEIALFDPGPRTATVTARTASRLWRVGYGDVMTELHHSPALAVELLRLAGQRMRWMGHQLKEHVFLPLPARLAQKILHLTAHDDAPQPVLSLSHLELAEFAGASREAVSKTLSGWGACGHIALSRGAIKILDRQALQTLSEPTLF